MHEIRTLTRAILGRGSTELLRHFLMIPESAGLSLQLRLSLGCPIPVGGRNNRLHSHSSAALKKVNLKSSPTQDGAEIEDDSSVKGAERPPPRRVAVH